MSDQSAEPGAGDVLRALGKVPLPPPRVLDDAREALWSAIASEMLGMAPERRAPERRVPERRVPERRETTRRRQAGRSDGERKRSSGGGDQGG